ncbi:hypothetical protein A7K91_19525 [Paenibacillus oryzae]|jgi:hypothetical protein|uniref:Uncharacterized protein n=1 Tax=Paenibacillus oryzae TaxID=1844972 RepID=A0A1A5YPE3_9BACL|nr:hypothetical protein [Paenibacillus oryzae]OBR67428.1 hypothetical protein A7K91_19525 [Paenibacillus oryzae]
MESVKLSQIVERLAPELGLFLTSKELELRIVLRDGIELLEPSDVMEIVQHSICNGQKTALLH